MDVPFYGVQCILKTGKKLGLFAAHYKQQFKSTMSHTDLRIFIVFNF